MTCNNQQYEDVCKGEFAELHKKLDSMDQAIRGNGKPGIQLRLDRLEQERLSRSKVTWFLLGIAGTIGGGLSTPGFVGHGKYNTTQRKFISGDGGIKRLVWMPKILKEEIGERFKARAEEMGVPGLLDMIADETVGVTEEEILPFLQEKGHPALTMESLLG